MSTRKRSEGRQKDRLFKDPSPNMTNDVEKKKLTYLRLRWTFPDEL